MFTFLLFLLGLCIGSFLNVLIDRIPREESIKGRSYCESCKYVLKWYDLIPLVSFVQVKGKCRYCGVQLSYYYPIVELVTGIMFVLIIYFVMPRNFQFSIFNFQFFLLIAYHLFLISSLIVIFFADLKYGIIPDKILGPIIVITAIFQIFNFQFSIFNLILSGVGAFLFFLLLFLGTRGKGIGFGDVKLAFFMGIFLGFPKIVVALYVAFLTGAFISIILVVGGWKKIKSTVPFGPFLVVGTLAALFFGEMLLRLL